MSFYIANKFFGVITLILTIWVYPYSIPATYAQKKNHFSGNPLFYQSTATRPSFTSANDSACYLVRFALAVNPAKYHRLKLLSGSYAIVRLKIPVENPADFLEIKPANAWWKASDRLAHNWSHTAPDAPLLIQLALQQALPQNRCSWKKSVEWVRAATDDYPVIQIPASALPDLLAQPDILFAEEVRLPVEELASADWEPGINQINQAHAAYPDIRGQDIKVAVKEQRYDEKDLDLLNRSFVGGPASSSVSAHATMMATTIGGNGNSSVQGKGVAPEVAFTSADFSRLLPDQLRYLTGLGITIENHSYGVGIENYYGIEAVEYDRQLYTTDTLVHVFSAGNAGTATSANGLYAGIPGRANLTGTFKQAKNALVVGGINEFYQRQERSSAGPAYDGRIKPELVAAGAEGTSGAAAVTSGVVALLQQSFRQSTGRIPSSALLKAVLVNSADDLANTHVDFLTGFGNVNAYQALKTLNEGRYWLDSIGQGEIKRFSISVADQVAELKITLAWNDPPAELNAPEALVNDLNVRVENEAGQVFYPWVLSSDPALAELNKPAIRGIDSLNNVEQVSLTLPTAGNYTVWVAGHRVGKGQAFALSYQVQAKGTFEWETPSSNEPFLSESEQVIRWNSTLTEARGRLYLRVNEDQAWQLIADSVEIGAQYFSWKTPALFAKAQLKMEIGALVFTSAAFSLSSPLSLRVGYQCPNEWLLHWKPQPNAIGYAIYTWQNGLLTRHQTVNDTLVKLSVNPSASPYVAVSALGEVGVEGIRSATIDVSQQGVTCYVRSLLAEAENDKINVSLALGTAVGLTKITWQKMENGQYVDRGVTSVSPSQLQYEWVDQQPEPGILQYRALLHAATGDLIPTQEVRVTYVLAHQLLLLPNPIEDQLTVLSGDLGPYELRLFDVTGHLVLSRTIANLEEKIPLQPFRPGMYLCHILNNGKLLQRTKLIKR
jgi:hypothetical protein